MGWFQDGMEWGARALGNRSIVADPRRRDMRDIINTKIKFREKFRPFAPSVAAEAYADYFVDAALDPFMLQVYPIRPEKRDFLGKSIKLMTEAVELIQPILSPKEVARAEVIGHIFNQVALSLDGVGHFMGDGKRPPATHQLVVMPSQSRIA